MVFQIHNQYQKIVPFIIFVLALVLLFVLVRPMIVILLSAVLIAYIASPLHRRIRKKIPNEFISVASSLLIVVIIILIPFSFLTLGVAQQGYYFYKSLSSGSEKGALLGYGCVSADSEVCSLLNKAERFSLERLSKFGFDNQLHQFLPILEVKITAFILSIPFLLAQIFITLVIAYFILKDWKSILKKLGDLIPMRAETKERLTKEFENITHTVIYTQLFVALVQGIVAAIGFYIFGVPFPLLLGLITAFFALIPAVGTAVIWVPGALFLILTGYSSQNHFILAKGIGMLLYGMLVISTIDNILLATIVHAKAQISPIIIIVGVIGGAALFGVMGIFIGPILLPLLITYFETFKERFA